MIVGGVVVVGRKNELIWLNQLLSSYAAALPWPASTRKLKLKTKEARFNRRPLITIQLN